VYRIYADRLTAAAILTRPGAVTSSPVGVVRDAGAAYTGAVGKRGGTPEKGAPELCDLCGAVVGDETELYALVPDSSAIHAHDPKFDGKRLVACTDEHLRQLVEQYHRRPFIDAELWAGKIYRAVEGNRSRRRIDDDALVELTGLTGLTRSTPGSSSTTNAPAFREPPEDDES
jgi:hypothetical protein